MFDEKLFENNRMINRLWVWFYSNTDCLKRIEKEITNRNRYRVKRTHKVFFSFINKKQNLHSNQMFPVYNY